MIGQSFAVEIARHDASIQARAPQTSHDLERHAIIVQPEPDRLRLVTQSDHAHLSSAILGLWRADGMPSHPRRQALLFAAREHDNGWREADAAPRVDLASGRPHDFLSLPAADRRDVWKRGTARHAEQHPLAAALILEHALTLHASHDGDSAWSALLASWKEARATLLETLEMTLEALREDYRFVAIVGALALTAAGGYSRDFTVHGHEVRCRHGAHKGRDVEVVAIEPFPLAGATTFRLPCRYVPDRRFTSDSDLALAAATARWQELPVRLVPAEGDSL